MLLRYRSNSGVFEFVERSASSHRHESTFTIVIGKNGTGKSRMLSAVAQDLLHRYGDVPQGFASRGKLNRYAEVEHTRAPTRLICVSTSPFDRFPLLDRHRQMTTYYSYLGLRGLSSQNLGAAYLGRVMAALLGALEARPEQSRALANVLRYLQYDPHLEATFHMAPNSLLEALASRNPERALEDYSRRPMIAARENLHLLRQLLELPEAEYRELVETALENGWRKSRKLRVYITPEGLSYGDDVYPFRVSLAKMARYGLIRLREARFFRLNEPVSMSDLSSGEQSVMMSLLGIGSQICDGALICIDEPEVCLHPEWQARYIELLYQTFENYRGCHFVIATHSPQIVAHLPRGNCYISPMESGIAQRSDSYAGRSADFQLARLFDAPGHRNEYLNRVAVNLFTRVAQARSFDQEAEDDLAMLERSMSNTDSHDPLRELVGALAVMRATYG